MNEEYNGVPEQILNNLGIPNKYVNHGENAAIVKKIIRPGSDEYDKIHNKDADVSNDTINELNLICDKITSSDTDLIQFINIFLNKVNESIISGKKISALTYGIYNVFKSITSK